MQPDFLVESRSYDRLVRGSWQACRLYETALVDKPLTVAAPDGISLWLPAGTPMHWATGTSALRSHCLQCFWPRRWYMLSAFYDKLELQHTYLSIIQPPAIDLNALTFVDLDLSILVRPDTTYEILTQAEFEQLAALLHYDEETRTNALNAMRTIISSLQNHSSLLEAVPRELSREDLPVAQSVGAQCGGRK